MFFVFFFLFFFSFFQKKKRFCNKLILKTRVKVEVHPLSSPSLFLATANFRGICVLTQVLKKCEEKSR